MLIFSLSPFSHQSRRWSMAITCETPQIWCASRYIILCMYYLHCMYSSHRSLLCLASSGFRTPPQSEAKAGHTLKPSCPLYTNQAVWLIGMESVACSVSQRRVRRSGLPLWVHNSLHDSSLNEWGSISLAMAITSDGSYTSHLLNKRKYLPGNIFSCLQRNTTCIIDTAK